MSKPMITKEAVYSVVPVLQSVDTDDIAYRVYDRYKLAQEYDSVEDIRRRVARLLRDLRSERRICGGPNGWIRSPSMASGACVCVGVDYIIDCRSLGNYKRCLVCGRPKRIRR